MKLKWTNLKFLPKLKSPRNLVKSITRETDLLGLVHTDLGDLKHTMTRGGERFYVIFVDDHSRFTKLYLLRTKDEALGCL